MILNELDLQILRGSSLDPCPQAAEQIEEMKQFITAVGTDHTLPIAIRLEAARIMNRPHWNTSQ